MTSRNGPEQIFLLEPLTCGTNTLIQTDHHSSLSICRICASSTKLVLPIFEKEGLENNLEDKIHKYLPIQVSQDDLLPKVVCFQCTTTILTWHALIATCRRADTTLRRKLTTGIVNNVSKTTDSDNISDTTVLFIESVKEIILEIFKDVTIQEDCSTEYVCDNCNNEQFCDVKDLSGHLLSEHIPKTSSRETIETFIKDHIKIQESLDLNDHSEEENPPEISCEVTYRCKLCEERFTSPSRLVGHLHEHGAVDFAAGVACCGRRYCARAELGRHVRAQHRAALPATACRACRHRAPDAAALRAHVRARHIDRKSRSRPLGPGNLKRIPVACPVCDKVFSNKYNMAAHARSHARSHGAAGDGHACSACGRRYSTRGNLAAHARAAHAAPARACPACGERFARAGDLRRHAARHGPPTLRCPACPAAFHHADSLRRHRLAHEDSRPHACPRCARAFRQASHLAAHRRAHACGLLQGAG